MTADLFAPLAFTRGPGMKNRFMLAPLTNTQSHADGTLSDDEFRWLTYRAEGGFGLTMTCAAHVQRQGQGFPGQLGVFGDEHLRAAVQIARPRVVAKAGPESEHRLERSGRQFGDAREALEKALVIGNDGAHLRLLQHDL